LWLCSATTSPRISWNLPPEDLFDAAYTPSLWAVQKTMLMLLLGIVFGTIPLASILAAQPDVHRNLANAPRRRKPHINYPVRGLFWRLWGLAPRRATCPRLSAGARSAPALPE
jgi:hypothetical protein